MGPIRLQVLREDADTAKELLAEHLPAEPGDEGA
jgi:hypothetical protein